VDNTLPGQQPGVDNTLPGQPPRVDNTLPGSTYWMLVYTPGHGWKYVAVDPSLSIGGGPVLPEVTPYG
jgi:hypothetical protein